MLKVKLLGMLTGAALLAGALFGVFGVAPAAAQDDPAVIGNLSLVKYVCPTNVGNTGTSIPAICANANDPNGSDVPVIPVNGDVSFIYQVTYSCNPGVICEPLTPISVTIADNQLPSTTPTEYGPQLDANNNGLIDPGDIWLYKVIGLRAIDLAVATVLPNGTPVPSGCAAAQGGSRPTYINSARVTSPSASQEDPAAYCNPLATATPTFTPTPTGTQPPTATPTQTPAPRPTDSPARPVEIPEPITVVLFGTGLAALSAALAARKRPPQ
ncbi:MAG TPA: PEP-CTERM sorting domain-containing protein [Chloroflexi bacterium]|nr:PEP-CTERM sorting domain-containing protein [Chloroflexota bacterium]